MQNVPYSWVEKLFANWTMMYGNRMDKMWNGMDKGQVIMFWHLKLEGLTREEFTRGVKASERLEYPPTLPQFLNLCRPPIDKTKAYYEAVKGVQERRFGRKGEWSHPNNHHPAARNAKLLLDGKLCLHLPTQNLQYQ